MFINIRKYNAGAGLDLMWIVGICDREGYELKIADICSTLAQARSVKKRLLS